MCLSFLEHELLVDILASVDITVGTVSSILMAQKPPQKESTMTSNINELLSLTGFELAKLGDQFEAKYGYESDTSNTGDVSKLLALNTQTSSNAGVSIEMEVDLTDWKNAIR